MAETDNSPSPQTLMIITLIQQAEIDILLSLCEAIAAQQGVENVGGVSIREWVQQQKVTRVEEIRNQIQTTDPDVAAKLQSVLEECRKPIGEDGKGH